MNDLPEDLPGEPKDLAAALVGWFRRAKRDLPWRQERTPYRVWLSEVMLQQTRVSVVIDYFNRFVARFPDVASLAAASEEDVLKLWSGLGYYSRGRNLHRAARAVVDDHGGAFPSTATALRTLPGIGDYTAAAVASLAFGDESAAVVDGNVKRVLARLCNDADPVDEPRVHQRMAARALALVEAAPAGSRDVNEGLMELGALVCTPQSPACLVCPWRDACCARAAGTAAALPKKSPKRARKAVHVASVVIVDEDGRVWLEKRESKGLFGGLREPPSVALGAGGVTAGVTSGWRSLLEERGVRAPKKWPAPVMVERQLTHRDLTFSVARVDVKRGHAGPFVDDVAGAALSSAVRAVLASVGVR